MSSGFVPAPLRFELECFVRSQHEAAVKYENRSLLDGPGIRALRDLIATAYSSGYSDGHQAGDADRWFDEQIRRDFTEAGEE